MNITLTPATRTQRTLSIALSNLDVTLKSSVFEWLRRHPEIMAQFSNHMAGTQAVLATWMDTKCSPLEKNHIEGAATQEDTALFDDVGGNKGRDL